MVKYFLEAVPDRFPTLMNWGPKKQTRARESLQLSSASGTRGTFAKIVA